MSWVAVAVVGGLTLGTAGAITSATADHNPQLNSNFLQNPEYPHSQDARDAWWNKLNTWKDDPNYGAVTPDWSNIWDTVQRQVGQYYNGGPLTPGLQDKVSSSLARRNMSDNPAADYLHAQVGAQQGNTLADAATQQAIQKTNLAEQGRQSWLSNINSFQGQKPQGEWNNVVSYPGANQMAWGNAMSGIGSSVATLGMAGGQAGGFQNLLNGSQWDKYINAPTYAPSAAPGWAAGKF